jgi:hypothetical protein
VVLSSTAWDAKTGQQGQVMVAHCSSVNREMVHPFPGFPGRYPGTEYLVAVEAGHR